MKNDFKPVVDHRFNLRADWGAVDCQVLRMPGNVGSEGFSGCLLNGSAQITATRPDIIRSLLTVG